MLHLPFTSQAKLKKCIINCLHFLAGISFVPHNLVSVLNESGVLCRQLVSPNFQIQMLLLNPHWAFDIVHQHHCKHHLIFKTLFPCLS